MKSGLFMPFYRNGDSRITALDALSALQMSAGKKARDSTMDTGEDDRVAPPDTRRIQRTSARLGELI